MSSVEAKIRKEIARWFRYCYECRHEAAVIYIDWARSMIDNILEQHVEPSKFRFNLDVAWSLECISDPANYVFVIPSEIRSAFNHQVDNKIKMHYELFRVITFREIRRRALQRRARILSAIRIQTWWRDEVFYHPEHRVCRRWFQKVQDMFDRNAKGA